MAGKAILTPGNSGGQACLQAEPTKDTSQYLERDNFLGEYSEESEKQLVRENLEVYPKTSVYTKLESDTIAKQLIKDAFATHLNSDDPHGILPQVNSQLEGMVKDDGSTPFKAPQTGVDPIAEFHLTTKRFVTSLLDSHLRTDDPHNIMDKVNEALTAYTKLSQVYLKQEVYKKNEVDALFSPFIKKDGSTPFIKAQLGVDPIAESHLATKRYVDSVMNNHLVDIDPHGFMSILNQRLALYYKKSDTYSKAETYSRAQIDSIINSLVIEAAKGAIEEHINSYDPHGTLKEIYGKHYVQRDGTIPFTAPQSGVEGTEENHLVVLSQLNEQIGNLKKELQKEIKDNQPVWKTSGPVQTTVGFVEDNSEVANEVTFQEAMDAIFYGQAVAVSAPPTAVIGESVEVNMQVHGIIALQHAELFQNEILIGTFTGEDFKDGFHSIQSNPVTEDTVFKFVVTLISGVEHTVTCTTKVALPVFVGLLPQWKPAYTVSFEYLQELVGADSINNEFTAFGDEAFEITHKYNFSTPEELKHLFIAMPKSYPDLVEVITPAQNFGIDAFDVISDIPFQVPGAAEDVIYKLYVYRQALAFLDSEITYKFQPLSPII